MSGDHRIRWPTVYRLISKTEKCLDGRRATGNERPIDERWMIDLRSMQMLYPWSAVVVVEPIEERMKRTERVAE